MNQILTELWTDYTTITPDAQKVHDLLEGRGERIVNDHVAFRTFNCAPISIKDFHPLILKQGYTHVGTLHFDEKKLDANYYSPPDPFLPRIFISELILEDFSPRLQSFCKALAQKGGAEIKKNGLRFITRPWGKIAHADYEWLLKETEYAAWVAAFGIRANHFTVSVNHLKTIKGIEALNTLLKEKGFTLNSKGGEVKGTKEQMLRQSSTMAKTLNWEFADGTFPVMSCYYEFAERFSDPKTGKIFDGFIPESANKIFESTYRG